MTNLVDSLEAVNAFRATLAAFDMVISEQTMPKLTELELCRKIVQVRQDSPILLCTGYNKSLDREQSNMGVKGEIRTKLISMRGSGP